MDARLRRKETQEPASRTGLTGGDRAMFATSRRGRLA